MIYGWPYTPISHFSPKRMREQTPEPRPTNCTRAAAEKEKKNISTRIRTCAVRLQRITRPWPQPLGQADTYMQVWNVRSVSIYCIDLIVYWFNRHLFVTPMESQKTCFHPLPFLTQLKYTCVYSVCNIKFDVLLNIDWQISRKFLKKCCLKYIRFNG